MLVLIGAASIVILLQERPAPPVAPEPGTRLEEQPQLTREIALELLSGELWAECLPQGVEGRYVSCEVGIERMGETWTATVTHNGLFDDSVRASRVEADIAWRDGRWIVENVLETQLCRNREEFSTEICV